MWCAFTGTTCSPHVPESLRPTFFIALTCSGHCSTSVTSWPAFVSMPPTMDPMAPPAIGGERETVSGTEMESTTGPAAFESRSGFRYNRGSMPTDLLTLTRERAHDNLFWRYLGVQVDD